jgi:beta-N-acetylhexosaminidase
MDCASHLMIDLSGPSLTPDERAFLVERRPGGVCLFGRNVTDRVQVAELNAELRSLAGPELLVAVDQEGGGVVRITDVPFPPSAMALGAADDTALTQAVAAATGRGLRALGLNVDFAPVADVNSNPANPVIADRSFGADPQQAARHVAAFVRGLQGEGVAATVKHFPGHGDVAIDSHLDLPTLDRDVETLERLEFPPFIAAIASGVAAVMSAHIVLDGAVGDGLPATLSRRVMTGLLRERLGFGGVVFTDSLDMKAVASHWPAPEAAVMAVAAGVDMPVHVAPVREHEEIIVALERALEAGRLDPDALEASAARLARLAAEYPARPEPTAAWSEGGRELLALAARRSLVALGRLPRLEPGSRVLLVTAAAVRQGAATQMTVRPGERLSGELRDRGLEVEELAYQPDRAGEALAPAVAKAPGFDAVIFATSSRTAITESERSLGRRLAAAARTYVHLALWNPYSTAELPGPALVTFGWREHSLAAAADALTGQAVTGVPPVPLRTFDDVER